MKPTTPDKPKRGIATRPTLEARKDPAFIAAINTLLGGEVFREALAMIAEQSPIRTVELPVNADAQTRSNLCSEERGFWVCWELFHSLGILFKEPKDIPATFPDPMTVNPNEITP
jgi:hypothetical protein